MLTELKREGIQLIHRCQSKIKNTKVKTTTTFTFLFSLLIKWLRVSLTICVLHSAIWKRRAGKRKKKTKNTRVISFTAINRGGKKTVK